MSQNPNGPNYNPNYNPNPYGPNPSPVNPNYPPISGTTYGGPQSPSPTPSGSNPGYFSYPSPNPPSGPNPNPNMPNSSYGPYSNPSGPYAPPPPVSNPYPDSATPPPPPATGPNPYDPYAPTARSQQPLSNPGYPSSYPAYPPVGPTPVPEQIPISQPPPTPQTKSRAGLIAASVISLIIIIGGSILGVVAYNNHQNTLHVMATAVANAHLTATAQSYATATAVASNYPFSNNQVLDDPMVDNSKHLNWDNDKASGCFFSGSAYHVVEDQSGFYNTCAAVNTNYANFTFETEMVIRSGGDSGGGGLLFRANEGSSKYYRLSIDTTGNYFALVIVDKTGTGGNARILKQSSSPASGFSTGLGQTNTLAIVARGSQFSFYVNQQLVDSFSDGTYSNGEIGFDADYGSSKTELLFTNTKVWLLP